MNLVWKLLRKHISIPQFAGFFLANLFGMLTVLLGIQFYSDIKPVFTAKDSFMKSDYVIVSKKIGMGTTISSRTHNFSTEEIEKLQSQDFIDTIGVFTSAEYKVEASLGINGQTILNTELPLESVPDDFIQVSSSDWSYEEGSREVPIILPRSYINMYNFGFAQSRRLPQIRDGLMGLIDLRLFIKGSEYRGRVVAFSSRLSSILVPEAFMRWSNRTFAPDSEPQPSRLLARLSNPADERVEAYMEKNGYEMEDDRLQAEKATHLLRVIMTMVLAVGLIISALSFYILMLSIYLLVQKNSEKLENLLLIGYSPARVARPYQLLTIGLNALVVVIALILLVVIRNRYMAMLSSFYPDVPSQGILPAVIAGLALFLLVSVLNILAIRRKVMSIWKSDKR